METNQGDEDTNNGEKIHILKAEKENIGNDVIKFKIIRDHKNITYQEAIDLLSTSPDFIVFYNDLLKNCPYEAYFWEVRSVTIETVQEDFEFVLVNSLALSKVKADKSSFANYFGEQKFVTSFANLNGDARLIVPIEITDPKSYAHIANFVRSAPDEQIIEFWKKVGEEFKRSIGKQPKWLSTSGLGVYWLHVRIDSNPKYYSYRPYKEISL